MTNEEAIKILQGEREGLLKILDDVHYERQKTLVALDMAIQALKNVDGEWIPITYRPMAEEEKKYYEEYTNCDLTEMFDCPMPEDGQEILVSTKYGTVSADICCNNDVYGCGLENHGDWEDILAWMPLPEPYKAESEDKE